MCSQMTEFRKGLRREIPPTLILMYQSSNEIFPLFRVVVHPNGFLQALLQKVQSPLQFVWALDDDLKLVDFYDIWLLCGFILL